MSSFVPRRNAPLEAQTYLRWIGVSSVLSLAALSVLFGWRLKVAWATPMLLALPLLLASRLNPAVLNRETWRKLSVCWSIVFAIPLIAYAGEWWGTPRFLGWGRHCDFPGTEIGQALETRWQSRYGTKLTAVIGDEWNGAIVGWYAPARPATFIWREGPCTFNLTPDQLKQTGAVVVWTLKNDRGVPLPESTDPSYAIESHFGPLVRDEPLEITNPMGDRLPTIKLGVAWLPPGTHSDKLAQKPDPVTTR